MQPPFLSPGKSFPPTHQTNDEGIIALGGDLSTERLLEAYSKGIFPWPHPDAPLIWFCPDPRWVIEAGNHHVSRSLARVIRKGTFSIGADTNFKQVMLGCANAPRPGSRGTWIDEHMIEGYVALHREGFAHSIEAYQNGELVGGMYGISLGGVFFGESMFSAVPNASKVVMAHLLDTMVQWDFDFLDCQTESDHLKRFGACPLERSEFIERLEASLQKPTRRGPWELPPLKG